MALTELSDVSRRIKQLRKQAGLKQYEVSEKANVPPRTYQSWENGEVETDRENYAKIGKVLGASDNWILFGQETEPVAEEITPPRSESEAVARLRVQVDGLLELCDSRHSELLSALAEVHNEIELLRKNGLRPGREAGEG